MQLQDIPAGTETGPAHIAPDVFAHSVLQLLQKKPERYKTFGIYWWVVKAVMRHYYSRDNLYLLGKYEDRDGASRVPKMTLQETLAHAIEEHRRNSQEGNLDGHVVDAAGEPYVLVDPDAE